MGLRPTMERGQSLKECKDMQLRFQMYYFMGCLVRSNLSSLESAQVSCLTGNHPASLPTKFLLPHLLLKARPRRAKRALSCCTPSVQVMASSLNCGAHVISPGQHYA